MTDAAVMNALTVTHTHTNAAKPLGKSCHSPGPSRPPFRYFKHLLVAQLWMDAKIPYWSSAVSFSVMSVNRMWRMDRGSVKEKQGKRTHQLFWMAPRQVRRTDHRRQLHFDHTNPFDWGIYSPPPTPPFTTPDDPRHLSQPSLDLAGRRNQTTTIANQNSASVTC